MSSLEIFKSWIWDEKIQKYPTDSAQCAVTHISAQPIGKSVESLKDHHEEYAYHLIGILHHKIIACGRLHNNSSTEAQIRYMAVDKELRGKGIGKKIVNHLENYAKKKSN